MKTLALKTYSRAEIAKIIKADPKDPHFARKVKDTLQKWGYSYHYQRTQVTILKAPQTTEDKIAEIALRELGLDARINSAAFAAFLFALQFNEEFSCSPWDTKVKLMKEMFEIEVSESTLKRWTKKLLNQGVITRDLNRELWCTAIIDNKKQQFRVTDFENYRLYKEDMQTFLNGRQKNWSNIYRRLWTKYKAVYYWCQPFVCNTLVNENIQLMFKLVEDLYIYDENGATYNSEIEETLLFY